MTDGSSILFTIAILFGVGFGIVRWMPRIRPLEERIRNWSIGLGILSGFFSCLVPVGQFTQSNDLASTVIFGVMSGASAGFLWFFVIAAMTFAYQYILAPPFLLLGRWKQRRAERRTQRAEEQRRSRELQDQSRMAPIHEQARQATEAQKLQGQRRREDARANCELYFGLYAAEIGGRFPREQFDAFVAKYMTDKHAPEDVERRAEQLRALVDQHREQVKPMPKFASIEELAKWFTDQKERIESLPLDEKTKRTHLAELNQRYAELTTELLRKMKPL